MASSTYPCSTNSYSADGQDVNSQSDGSVIVTCEARWEVYHRLQELGFDCQCGGFQPLQVQVKTPADAIQLWSVLRRVSQPRLVLANRLQQCWQSSTSDF